MKKVIIGIFLSLGAFFLMSHNAAAVTTTLNMNEYDVIGQQGQLPVNCEFYGVPTSQSNVTECTARANTTSATPTLAFLRKMSSVSKWSVKTGDVIEFDLNVFTPIQSITPYSVHLYFLGGSADFTAMEYKQTVNNNQYYGQSSNFVKYQSVYHVIYRARHDGDVYIGLTSSQHWFEWLSGNDTYMTFAIYNVMHYRYSGSQENKEQEEATQNAADDSETSGNESQSSSQGATSNLLSVFTGFANVITNATPSSCIINAPLNTTFSSDRFNVDFCGLDLPPAIGALTSIIAIMAVVPFAISMFNKFIAIMQGFQR